MGFHPGPPVLLAALAWAGCAIPGRGGEEEVRAVPLYGSERPVPSAPWMTDVLLPFGHGERSAARETRGIRPLFRAFSSDDTEGLEVLYPLFRTRREKGEVLTRLFPIYWHDEFTRADGSVDSDTAILPILLWGSDPAEGSYFLLFPLGGTAKQKLLSDQVTMVLFPLYVRTATGAYRGNHVLWPLIHWGSDGKDVHAFRFWPFYGESVHEGRFSRHTALWPVVHWASEDLHKAHPTEGWSVWPLFGTEGSVNDAQSASYALWPFFSWADGPRAYERSLPYPLFRIRREYGTGPDGKPALASELFWLWPFYGRYDRGTEERSRFYLWPIVFTRDLLVGGLREKGLAVMPLYREVAHETPEGEPVDLWWKFWPLAQGETKRDGTSGWSALAPIPWFRWEEFDANWGIFFELCRVRSDPGGARSVDLLFSLLRWRTSPDGYHHRIPLVVRADRDATGSSWSILEGLLGTETDAEGRTSLRLLWFLRIPLSGGGP